MPAVQSFICTLHPPLQGILGEGEECDITLSPPYVSVMTDHVSITDQRPDEALEALCWWDLHRRWCICAQFLLLSHISLIQLEVFGIPIKIQSLQLFCLLFPLNLHSTVNGHSDGTLVLNYACVELRRNLLASWASFSCSKP